MPRNAASFEISNLKSQMSMTPNLDKIDDAVLALLHLTSFRERKGELPRAWKGHDWDTLGRLHAKGYIGNPVGKAKSVVLSEAGAPRAEELFVKMFCTPDAPVSNLKSEISDPRCPTSPKTPST
jgi:hypothetical protein